MTGHVRSWLGPPAVLREIQLEGGASVALLSVTGAPCDGATTIVTSGLGDLDHRLHEELVVTCWSDGPVHDLTLVVEVLVRQLAEGREPLLYGDVVGPAGPLVPGMQMEAIYTCEPTYFPEGFARFVSDDGCEIRVRWLLPIYAEEAYAVDAKGASYFEDLLAERDPDLLTLDRPSVLGG